MAEIEPTTVYQAFKDIARYYGMYRETQGTFYGWDDLDRPVQNALLNLIENRVNAIANGIAAPFVGPVIPGLPGPPALLAAQNFLHNYPAAKVLIPLGAVGIATIGRLVYNIQNDPKYLDDVKELVEKAKVIIQNSPEAQIVKGVDDLVRGVYYGREKAYPIQADKIILPDKPFDVPEPENPGSERLLRLQKIISINKLGPNSPEQYEVNSAEKVYNEWKQARDLYTQGILEKVYMQGPASEAAVKAEESGQLPALTAESAAKLAEFEQPKIAAAGAKSLTEWQKHVKKYAAEHKLTYFDALKKAKSTYKKSKKVSK